MNELDIVVIGAGIHGAGVAQAAAAAGYGVLVLEKNEIAAGTSSKSSKLIHGGLRYLESYQFSLVRKSLKERAILCRLAPDLVKLQPFYIPIYKKTTRRPWQIQLGLSLYAFLGGLHKENLFKRVKRKDIKKLDQLKQTNLQKVYQYNDGQTNDVSLTKAVMFSAKELGAELKCPASVVSIVKNEKGFKITYKEDNQEKSIQAKVIVNATGPWVNELHELVTPKVNSLDIDLVQGTHIIIDAPAPSGIYYLEAEDKRAVFVMPYEFEGELKTMIGTTEKLFQGKADDVKPGEEEVEYLLNLYKSYFPKHKEVNVIHKFAGLRVLPKDDGSMFARPRDTILHWVMPNLLTLYGGKVTAYRSTSELVIKKIKPFLDKRQRVAHTDQLYLSVEI
jgi:glycerol-3-phosphate dehydrogenase